MEGWPGMIKVLNSSEWAGSEQEQALWTKFMNIQFEWEMFLKKKMTRYQNRLSPQNER